jgi:hypothetical protein
METIFFDRDRNNDIFITGEYYFELTNIKDKGIGKQ